MKLNLDPLKILKEAIRAVPAVKYALGVAGIVSVVAIVTAFGINPQLAVIGTVITLVLMVALVVFAKLTTTAKRHFFLPVMVLMWSFLVLTIATAGLLFSTVFFKWPVTLPDLIHPTTATNRVAVATQPIGDLLKAAQLQLASGDYQQSWKSLQEALSRQPDSAEARQAQVQLAMIWLRNISTQSTFSEVVDPLLPCLYQAAAQAKGALAADLYAHIGWANFLKSRDVTGKLEVEAHFKRAVDLDPGNPYANAMWGHWTLSQRGKLSEARERFAAALKTGRERPYVRELQIAALRWVDSPENRIEIVRVSNDIRKNHETLPPETRRRIVTEAFSQTVLQQRATPLPPDEQLATYLWLKEGLNLEESGNQIYLHAQLAEAAGDYSKALTLYLMAFSRPSGFTTDIKAAILRCRQRSPASKSDVQILIEAAQDRNGNARERALQSLPKLEVNPAEILPTLIRAAKDDSDGVRMTGCDTLVEVGAPAVPAILQMLEGAEPRDVQNAAILLGKIHADPERCVPALIQLLKRKSESRYFDVRASTASALGEFGAAAKDAVPGLIEVIRTEPEESPAYASATYALGEIGPAAKDAVPELIKMLPYKSRDDDDGYRGARAAEALGKIGPAAKAAVPALVATLKEDRLRVPAAAAEALGKIGADAQAALPALVELMQSTEKDYRADRAEAIGKIAQSLMEYGDTNSIPALKQALRAMEAENLEPRITGPVREAVETLQEKMQARAN